MSASAPAGGLESARARRSGWAQGGIHAVLWTVAWCAAAALLAAPLEPWLDPHVASSAAGPRGAVVAALLVALAGLPRARDPDARAADALVPLACFAPLVGIGIAVDARAGFDPRACALHGVATSSVALLLALAAGRARRGPGERYAWAWCALVPAGAAVAWILGTATGSTAWRRACGATPLAWAARGEAGTDAVGSAVDSAVATALAFLLLALAGRPALPPAAPAEGERC